MRWMAGLVLLACVSGCTSDSVFACSEDSECDLAGTPGYCDAPGYCSFEDAACPSGRRFGSLAGMGLADECVAGDAGSTGPSNATTSMPPPMGTTTTLDPTTGDADTSATGESTSTGAPTTSETGRGSTGGSSSTGSGPMCTIYDFDRDPGFVDQGVFVDVAYDGGQMVVEWEDALLGSAAFGIASGVDVTGGSIETEFATLPTEEGTLLSVRWRDTSGRIVSADLDGSNYLVGYYNPSLPEGMKNLSFGNEPHLQRPILRMREEGGTVVVEAADGETTDELGSITEPFDPVGVEVWMFFNRYQSQGMTTRIALETLTTCE